LVCESMIVRSATPRGLGPPRENVAPSAAIDAGQTEGDTAGVAVALNDVARQTSSPDHQRPGA
jgi:hypothetical protein